MNIYIGNLPYGATQEDLENLFREKGEVKSAKIITDRETGRSKGFGFVEMPDKTEAEQAIQELNGYELQGRSLIINEAREKSGGSRPPWGGRPGRPRE